MKFILPAWDHDFAEGMKSGTVNGGTVWLQNLANGIRKLGHEADLVPLDQPAPKADVMVVQSEWASTTCAQSFHGIRVVLLGHFIGGPYQDPLTIDADLFCTTWSGPTVEDFEARKKQRVHFLPHAYPAETDTGEVNAVADVPWIGNAYPLRNDSVLDGMVRRLYGIMPTDLPAIYRGAKVCPNLHADSQKGLISEHPSRVNVLPGFAINERFWTILGAGGVLVTDAHPQYRTFFEKDDLITADSPEQFTQLVKYYRNHPAEGVEKLANARDFIRSHHTYTHRAQTLLDLIAHL